jgi:two-component system nitrate/nitrite sensor histidine kinase NarX
VLVLGISVFVIELGIMALLPLHEPGHEVEVFDAALLTTLLAPILYLTLFRPLNREIAERELAQEELRRAQAGLELQVEERTAALTKSLHQLQTEIAQRRVAEAQLVREIANRQAAEESLQRRVVELDLLQQLERALADRQDLDDAVRGACGHISSLLDAEFARIDLSGDQVAAPVTSTLLRVPLTVKGECMGELSAGRDPSGPPFTSEDRRLALTVADRLATVVENERLRARERERAAADERERLARDLHDAVTQNIYSASLIAEALPAVWRRSPAEGRRNLERLRLLVRGSLAEMRTLLFELRPAALEGAELEGLLERLGDVLAGQLQIPVEINVEGREDPPVDVKIALYRVVQEAFSNISKHAHASSVSASLVMTNEQVAVRVIDDGCGFDAEAVSANEMGLRIMRERMNGIGATLIIQSAPGQGTVIAASWPRASVNDADDEEGEGWA